MKPLDFIILAAIAVALFFAVRAVFRDRKGGGCRCGSGCSGCPGRHKKCGK